MLGADEYRDQAVQLVLRMERTESATTQMMLFC